MHKFRDLDNEILRIKMSKSVNTKINEIGYEYPVEKVTEVCVCGREIWGDLTV